MRKELLEHLKAAMTTTANALVFRSSPAKAATDVFPGISDSLTAKNASATSAERLAITTSAMSRLVLASAKTMLKELAALGARRVLSSLIPRTQLVASRASAPISFSLKLATQIVDHQISPSLQSRTCPQPRNGESKA